MPKFTYTPGAGEPEEISTLGFDFKAGEAVTVPDDFEGLDRLRGNPFFKEEGGKERPKGDKADDPEAKARAAALLRARGGDDGPKVPGEPGYVPPARG